MAYSIANNPLLRKNFAKIKKIIDIPNLIDIQKNSYKRFLQIDVPAEARKNIGLETVFRSVFPIRDFSETASLEYVSYFLGTPKYDVEECHQRGMTFAAPMKVKVRLVVWDINKETQAREAKRVRTLRQRPSPMPPPTRRYWKLRLAWRWEASKVGMVP